MSEWAICWHPLEMHLLSRSSSKHQAHKKKKQREADKEAAAEKADHAQTEVENMATWALLGKHLLHMSPITVVLSFLLDSGAPHQHHLLPSLSHNVPGFSGPRLFVMNFNCWAHQLHPSAGGNSSGLWLLSEEQLVKQCSESGLEVTGTKNELITRLAQHRKGQLTLGENCCSTDKCF